MDEVSEHGGGRFLDLHIRHDDPESLQSQISYCQRAERVVRANFERGEQVGIPTVRALEFSVGTCGETEPAIPKVTLEPGLFTTLEVVANLAEPIPGRDTKRVYLISAGLRNQSRVHDADTGELIMASGFRVRIEGGKTPQAWVDPYVVAPLRHLKEK